MQITVREIADWLEVWALLIPIAVLIWKRNRSYYLLPVRIYVWVALFLNGFAIAIWKFKVAWGMEEGDFLWSNNFIYNTHSVIRLYLFSWYFIRLGHPFMQRVKLAVPILFTAFLLVNFIWYEDFFNRENLSSRLLATEAAMLLLFCLQYFIYLLLEDRDTPLKDQPGFWVGAGLSIYVASSFFIFLFYTYLISQNPQFAVGIWDVHNIAYLLLCISIARAFYETND